MKLSNNDKRCRLMNAGEIRLHYKIVQIRSQTRPCHSGRCGHNCWTNSAGQLTLNCPWINWTYWLNLFRPVKIDCLSCFTSSSWPFFPPDMYQSRIGGLIPEELLESKDIPRFGGAESLELASDVRIFLIKSTEY